MKKGTRIEAFPAEQSGGAVLRLIPLGAARRLFPTFMELIPDPNENLGVKVDPQREQHHDSELGYLSDLCSRLCCIALEYMFGLASTPDEKT
ncbi:hypothetical protein F2Q68_00044004 [Brassica cretica]|uniref:Uncharacterized protein n=2 Tax=Brassica cretica TaxID=69181 RepID=A0ABQ7B3P4_BRACR|nr:hypothetical protein F2Q68_00044004 [Brassica cretica]KAF3520823.1 hypothetical protein DY000_02060029 [Brassica cretica]